MDSGIQKRLTEMNDSQIMYCRITTLFNGEAERANSVFIGKGLKQAISYLKSRTQFGLWGGPSEVSKERFDSEVRRINAEYTRYDHGPYHLIRKNDGTVFELYIDKQFGFRL